MYIAKPGTFSGPVKVEWVKDKPRDMVVLEDIHFMDSKGVIWSALKGASIDGASIPRIFWMGIGSPFVGLYRRASVIHDVYCKTQIREPQAVHDVFKEMMIADGVSDTKAFLMYQAVDKLGPRW